MSELRFHADGSVPGCVHFAAKAADMDAYKEVLYWCTDRYGEPDKIEAITEVPERWAYYPYVIVLVRPDDILDFKLRWI
ncbi:MAG: hypothetical protein EOP83_32400 [Verrucomicrobiaceae bacterium]|nr:MAG: hypothetical protein EOP83_32400 [Verrucomicrobiaceae bacterium]